MIKTPSSTSQHGSILLLTILVLTTISSLFLATFLTTLTTSTKISFTFYHTQQALYGVEGAFRDTLRHHQLDSNWPPATNLTDAYSLDPATINRKIAPTEDDQIAVDLTATVQNSKRRLITTFTTLQTTAQDHPADILLALDKSGSMDDDGPDDCQDNNPYNCHPMIDAIEAAKSFIDAFDKPDLPNQIGAIKFSTQANTISPLVSQPQFPLLKGEISQLTANGFTDIGDAIKLAQEALESPNRNSDPETTAYIVLLTDGQANVDPTDSQCQTGKSSNYCYQQGETYALTQGNLAKNSHIGTIIYTIGLGENINTPFLQTLATTPDHALLSPQPEDLEQTFLQIAFQIAQTQTVSVSEALPE